MEHSNGGLYLPFICSAVGLGIGVLSTSPSFAPIFGYGFGDQLDMQYMAPYLLGPSRFHEQVMQNDIMRLHMTEPNACIRKFSDIVTHISPDIQQSLGIRGWIAFNRDTFVPIFECIRGFSDIYEFCAAFNDYPIYRVTNRAPHYCNVVACYAR